MIDNRSQFLVNWLNSFGLGALEQYGIKVSKDDQYPFLYNLKYNSIIENRSLDIVRACRGAVVEFIGNQFEVVAYGFDRFFNYGESEADILDWNEDITIYEKYDGSLVKLFYYNGEWIVSTSGTVAGNSVVHNSGITFADLFWQVFERKWYSLKYLNPNYVYIFELCHELNRVVVRYDEPQLPLIAVRDKNNHFNELYLEDFQDQFDVVETYRFDDIDHVLSFCSILKGSEHEGFVIRDSSGKRLKIKTDEYVNLHRVRCNGNPSFVDLWKRDNLTEFLIHFPEYENEFKQYTDRITELNHKSEEFVANHLHLNQKDFAIKALESGIPSGALFMLRKREINSFAEWLYKQPDRKVIGYLNVEDS